jgi:hypothetical protein
MTAQKYCPGCDRDLELDRFSWKNQAKQIRQTWCKSCLKEANRIHYLNNTQTYKDRAIHRNRHIITENKRQLFGFLSTHPCVDCGNTDIRVLDFDHVSGEKMENIAVLLAHSAPWSIIVAEIAKCEVRCANCHRIKTMERGGWWKTHHME